MHTTGHFCPSSIFSDEFYTCPYYCAASMLIPLNKTALAAMVPKQWEKEDTAYVI